VDHVKFCYDSGDLMLAGIGVVLIFLFGIAIGGTRK